MAASSRDLSLARDAIGVVERRISSLPASPEVDDLRTMAEDYLRQVDGWIASPPTPKECETLMKRVLKLHIEVAKIERRAPGT